MLETGNFQSMQAPADMESDDICWICLDGMKDRDPLINPCRCPRKVHPRCLARWQLQQAGRPEETNCRFCASNLADWKASLTPENLKPDVQRVQPIMVVYFEGQIHRIPVKQGPDGLKEFTHRIRELFRLPDDVDISLTFGCKEPLSGQHLKLEGIGAFDAAVHCASVAAAERQQKLKSGGGASDGPAGAAGGTPPASAGGAPSPAVDGAAAPEAASGVPANPSSHAAATHAASRQRLHNHYNSNNLNLNHQLHNHNYHRHHQLVENRSASALPTGAFPSSASAPASTQTSGGGADSDPTTGGLHAAASAPVLSHYASDTSSLFPLPPLASTATAANTAVTSPSSSPRNHPGSSSFPGCVTFSDEAASAHTSVGGGSSSGGGGGSAASQLAAAYSAAAARRGDTLAGPSPFQAAAMEAGRVTEVSSNSARRGPLSLASSRQRPQPQQPIQLASQQTAPSGLGAFAPMAASDLASQPALAGAISEPAPTRGAKPCSPPTPPSTSYTLSHHHQQFQYQYRYQQQQHYQYRLLQQQLEQQQQQQQFLLDQQYRLSSQQCPPIQPPMDPEGYVYPAFPYSSLTPADSPRSSPYASPLLPPLAAAHSVAVPPQHQHQEGQAAAPESHAASSSLQASEPSPVLLTPRDHYVARPGDACGFSAGALDTPLPQQRPSYPCGDPESASLAAPAAQSCCDQQGQASHAPDAEPATPTKDASVDGTPATLAAAGPGSSSPAGSPSTPVQPATRRAAVSPDDTPSALLAPLAAVSSPPSSSAAAAAPSFCRHEAPRSEVPPAGASQGEEGTTGAGAVAANRLACRCQQHTRPCQARQHEYEGGVPSAAAAAADDSVAVGSLTGRIKTSLKALSNKVRRSLNFQRGSGTNCLHAHALSPLSSMSEADGAEAVEPEEEQEEVCPAHELAVAAAATAAAVVAATSSPCREH